MVVRIVSAKSFCSRRALIEALRRNGVPVALGLAAVVCVLVAGADSADATTGVTTLVSVDDAGTAGGNDTSSAAVVTPNGRYVAFESLSSNLTANDGGGSRDVFVRDLQAGTTTLVSVNRLGTAAGNGPSRAPAISDNGRFVAFSSTADDLVEHDDNGVEDVFVRDLNSGVTTLVSINHDGTASGGGASTAPAISSNGKTVAFESLAADLVTNDGNGASDVFLRDVPGGVTTLASVNRLGTQSGTGASTHAVLTPSGRYIAFLSTANDLVANDSNTATDVFLRNVRSGITTLMSVNRDGTSGGKGESWGPLVSPSGRYVAFTSRARDLVNKDRNQSSDVFVRDRRAETTTVVSLSKNGKRTANGPSVALGMTPSGRYVVFSSSARNLVAGDKNGAADIYLRDLRTATTQLVSVSADGSGSGNGASDQAALSADGRYVLFASTATDLVAASTSGAGDIFVRDVIDATTGLVSVSAAGGTGGNGASAAPALTPDGRVALFASAASDLAAPDGNGNLSDVFLRGLR